MNKKWTKSLLMILLCVCCMFMFKSIKVNAAMTDEAEDYAKDRQRLMGVPMVTGYEALERHRGVRRPRRKLSRREKRAWKKAQKYEMKLHKAHEKEDKKRAKQEAKLAAREEKAAKKQAKKENKYKKKTKPAVSSSVKSNGKKGAVKKVNRNTSGGNKDYRTAVYPIQRNGKRRYLSCGRWLLFQDHPFL